MPPERIISDPFREALETPCLTSALTRENESKAVRFTNALQGLLFMRRSGGSENNDAFIAWIGKYARDFRTKFREVIEEDPLYFSGYTSVKDIPEDKIKGLEDRLYGAEVPEEAEVAA